jgi:hypothetical protein
MKRDAEADAPPPASRRVRDPHHSLLASPPPLATGRSKVRIVRTESTEYEYSWVQARFTNSVEFIKIRRIGPEFVNAADVPIVLFLFSSIYLSRKVTSDA